MIHPEQSKGGYEKILSEFGDGEADMMVGTQMIVEDMIFEM